MQPVVEVCSLTRRYEVGGSELFALRGVDLRVEAGEMVAIMGPSGSGKSTLMNILGCLDRPTSGECLIDGVATSGLDDNALAELRNHRLGFVFQGFHLLARTSALDNVQLPLLYDRSRRFPDPVGAATAALRRVGLGARLHHLPNELSGGQQQRVAIARALVTRPALVLADEPTGNLDSTTTASVLALLQQLNDAGTTLIVVTHEDDVAAACKRAIVLRDGRVVQDRPVDQRRVEDPL
jgi:putative ABC transport system ATP-binding protein